ncbi:flavodoxin family protein [Anaerosacchariphilus polymeriproducens]|uniref:Flavodoxin-like domain-containing protein n=1 Tax=Anaerosacchariphilus polymeriproducens TaxID=1812858 RepID=A0A371AVC0_9FIRM|nr:flavodoxin domain-containing protein [Anaerosacchariphilus polymeriproducens]RDU23517.1 hypothetical protein DWV06_09170 [Anaerosacchariphilus polymeriproducens]
MNIKKIVIRTIGILFLLVVVAVASMAVLFLGVNSKEQKNQENVLEGVGSDKALLLYQDSRGGLTGKAAKNAAESLHKKGYTVVMNHPRADLTYHLDEYNLVIFMTPVYAGKVSEPLKQYADSQDFAGKKVCIIVTGNSEEDKGEVDEMKKHVKNADCLYGKKVNSEKIDNVLGEFLEQ